MTLIHLLVAQIFKCKLEIKYEHEWHVLDNSQKKKYEKITTK